MNMHIQIHIYTHKCIHMHMHTHTCSYVQTYTLMRTTTAMTNPPRATDWQEEPLRDRAWSSDKAPASTICLRAIVFLGVCMLNQGASTAKISYTETYMCMYTYMYIYTYIYIYVMYFSLSLHVHVYIYVCVCKFTYLYVYIYVYTYIHVCAYIMQCHMIHTHTHGSCSAWALGHPAVCVARSTTQKACSLGFGAFGFKGLSVRLEGIEYMVF